MQNLKAQATEKVSNLEELWTSLCKRDDCVDILAFPKEECLVGLAAPTGLAHALISKGFSGKEELSIIVAGCEIIDVFKDGVFYFFLAPIIEELIKAKADRDRMMISARLPKLFKIMLCGMNSQSTIIGKLPPLPHDSGRVKVRNSPTYLGVILSNHKESYDVCVLFQPGFEEFGADWLIDHGLKRIIEDRADTVFVYSYAKDEQLIDADFIKKNFNADVNIREESSFGINIPISKHLPTTWAGHLMEVKRTGPNP
ncbi:MAG: hypothetical protein EOP06_01575 [Proteobacteria bacterium]|nr:MAG: hypothetical protein EOP06_01575 [Pseudomonadota bacterium]